MRVCPQCGFIDPPAWRSSIASRNIDFCKLEDFESMLPALAEKLKIEEAVHGTRNFLEDGIYVYHLTKGGFVERQALIDNPRYRKKWKIDAEASPHKNPCTYIQCIHKPLPKGQKRLMPARKRKGKS